MDSRLTPYHKPDRTVVLTGISRSGTSLLTALLNEFPNAVCFNEVLTADPGALPEAVARIRRDLLKGRPVPNKFDESGRPTTNTLEGVVIKEKRRVEKRVDAQVLVGAKRNIPYLSGMEKLLAHGFKAVIMIRDPVYTIGSWSSAKAAAAGIPGAQVGPDNVHPHWHGVTFTRNDVIERRAEAWQHYAELIAGFQERTRVFTYERLCLDTASVLSDLCAYLDLERIAPLPALAGKPRNEDRRYPDIARIRQAVDRLCPARKRFGYG